MQKLNFNNFVDKIAICEKSSKLYERKKSNLLDLYLFRFIDQKTISL